jgi:hypothetical protein
MTSAAWLYNMILVLECVELVTQCFVMYLVLWDSFDRHLRALLENRNTKKENQQCFWFENKKVWISRIKCRSQNELRKQDAFAFFWQIFELEKSRRVCVFCLFFEYLLETVRQMLVRKQGQGILENESSVSLSSIYSRKTLERRKSKRWRGPSSHHESLAFL